MNIAELKRIIQEQEKERNRIFREEKILELDLLAAIQPIQPPLYVNSVRIGQGPPPPEPAASP